MPPEHCSFHPVLKEKIEQFDKELTEYERKYYETLNEIRDLRRDFLSMVQEFGKHEKQINERVSNVEKEQENQRIEDAKRDKESAVANTKMAVVWNFLIEKNGLVIIGILAYVVLGERIG